MACVLDIDLDPEEEEREVLTPVQQMLQRWSGDHVDLPLWEMKGIRVPRWDHTTTPCQVLFLPWQLSFMILEESTLHLVKMYPLDLHRISLEKESPISIPREEHVESIIPHTCRIAQLLRPVLKRSCSFEVMTASGGWLLKTHINDYIFLDLIHMKLKWNRGRQLENVFQLVYKWKSD
jgi:hypothetical protein